IRVRSFLSTPGSPLTCTRNNGRKMTRRRNFTTPAPLNLGFMRTSLRALFFLRAERSPKVASGATKTARVAPNWPEGIALRYHTGTMAEQALIVAELKRALREHHLTYTDVARKLTLSVPTVKRLFSTGDFSLQRVDGICELMGTTLREILERAEERAAPVNQLTLTQEQEIVADPRLFFVTWLVLNRTQFEEIVRTYRFTERELLQYFIRLDRLQVIQLQPGNRARLLVSR